MTLDHGTTANPGRNGLWFRAVDQLETTLRLQFRIDFVEKLEPYFQDVLGDFQITAVTLVGRKTIVSAISAVGTIPIDTGAVSFTFACSVNKVDLLASVAFHESGIDPFRAG